MPSAEPPRGFPEAEYRGRLARAQAAMERAELDLLLLSTEADIRWFSGFLTPFWRSPTRPWFLLVPRSGEPVAVIPAIGAACMERTWLEDIRTWPAPRPDDDGVTLLAETLRELGGARFRLGVPSGVETRLGMPFDDFERLRAALPGAALGEAGAVMRGLRMVKSEAEIAKLRHVCALASEAFARLPDVVGPGMSLIEAFRDFRIECLRAGADEVAYLVGGAAPGGYADVISPPTGRALARGDVLMLDTGCTWDGYFCDFDRNVAIGDPAPDVLAAHALAWEATEAALATIRPGATFADLFRAMDAVLRRGASGHAPEPGRLGHGLGLELTEPGSIAPFDETPLELGMVLAVEPSLAFGDGRLMVHEENVVVREHGAELLSRRASERLDVVR